MRSGLTTIQQTLTPEAASVLNHSIAEAARRNHGQTTPLHVAATLLSSPSGFLRQACIRSHPNSSHPLQCRALELCFSVALDRLPSSLNSSSNSNSNAPASSANSAGAATSGSGGFVEQPPISNALMAALKRAQAHQRRGCPEQQQQPLLAVKVELEQLIVSILDDPSVSRVMREASFSSPDVKSTIEQSILASSSPAPSASNNSPTLGDGSGGAGGLLGGLGFRQATAAAAGAPLLPANRNLYLNPRLQQHQQHQGSGGGGRECFWQQRRDEVKKVLDILLRSKKRNPVLVGDSEPEAMMREVLQRIERREVGDGLLRNVQVISLEKQFASDRSQIPLKFKELGNSIETRFKNGGSGEATTGVILDLGDLKWLVESPGGWGSGQMQQQQQIISEMGRVAVAEMGKLLGRFAEGGIGSSVRLWLIGTATCATYLRCQVYHPTMESEWDLQAVPIAPRSPLPSMFPRINGGGNGILSSSVESLSPGLKDFPPMGATTFPLKRPSENIDPSRRAMCPVCTESYERELAKLVAKEFEKSSSDSKLEPRQPLPQWLQIAKLSNGSAKSITTNQLQTKEQELMWKQNTEELLKRWSETCARLHPSFHQPVTGSDRVTGLALSMSSSSYNSNSLLRNFQPKLQLPRSFGPLQVNNGSSRILNTPERPECPPGSPVRTDLVLGRLKPPPYETSMEKSNDERVRDLAGCAQDRFPDQQRDKIAGNLDVDSFKRLFKGLTEKVGWQPEAASAVATTVLQCQSGNRKRRGVGVKGDTWLLFIGPDKVGKKKMASALSELAVGTGPITVRLGDSQADGEDGESNLGCRGKTALDRVAEAVRRNPFSVVVLEDVDRADMLVRGSLKCAMEMGRLPDSHGREVALARVVFIMTSDTSPENLEGSPDSSLVQCEEKLSAAASSGWELELSVGEKTGKRRAEWLCEEDGRTGKPRKQSPGAGLSFDLNLAAGTDEEAGEGSRNSSDLTAEHENNECGRLAMIKQPSSSVATELLDSVDEAIAFKPVDFGPLRRKVSDAITGKFDTIVGDGRSLRIEDEALDRMVGGIWFGSATTGFEEWTEKVLVPSFQQLKSNSTAEDGCTVRLVTVKDVCTQRRVAAGRGGGGVGDWLPSKVRIAVNGLYRA